MNINSGNIGELAGNQSKIRKTKKPFFQNENGKSGRGKPKTKTSSFPTHAQK